MKQTLESPTRKPLRLWPGVVAVLVQLFGWVAFPILFPDASPWGMLVAVGAGLVFVLWWIFFSRAPWLERVGAIALMVVAVVATKLVVHESIAGAGMGMLLYILAIPVLSLALLAAVALTRRRSTRARRATMVGAILLACGLFTLLRTGGIDSAGHSDLHWRWTETPEDRLLSRAGDEPVALPAPVAANAAADWPGFRGPQRDSIVPLVQIESDWSKSPPVMLWRRPIGPGWSSFAVLGDLVYTQEQRGEEEMVSCYRLTTGAPVWRHGDQVRFWESNAGAGPRGTPTLHGGRIFTMGATGIVNALDVSSGAVVWSRDAAADTGKKIPHWGFASSPLVIDDLVVVAAAGQLVAYDIATGKPRWLGRAGGGGYSSPHFATIDGVAQVLLLSGGGAIGVAPADGTLLWEHSWEAGASIVQPALLGSDVLISGSNEMGGIGMRRLHLAHGSSGWTTEERWTTRGLKPYFNDFVVQDGAHAYGFDNGLLACIDLEDGARKWKGGRYGQGQMLLLANEKLLLVLSEDGELALVAATPEQFTELARFPAIEGKTWNHPVLVGDVLLVRNAEEMAAIRLPKASRE